eukprot:scaffold2599_cov131-Amphora_coffeaeformis.AAC.2
MIVQRAAGKRIKIVTAKTKYTTTDHAAKLTNPAATRSCRLVRSSSLYRLPYIHRVVTTAAPAETIQAPNVAVDKGGCVHTFCWGCAKNMGPARASGTTMQNANAHGQSRGHVGRVLGKELHKSRMRRKVLVVGPPPSLFLVSNDVASAIPWAAIAIHRQHRRQTQWFFVAIDWHPVFRPNHVPYLNRAWHRQRRVTFPTIEKRILLHDENRYHHWRHRVPT